MRNVKQIVAVGFGLVLSLVCFTAAVELPITAKIVPADTVLLLEINDFQQFKARFEKTNLYRLYSDPAMEAFIKDSEKKWRQEISRLDKNNIFRTIIDADVLPQGRIALVLILNKRVIDSDKPPIMVITQWGRNIDKIKEAVDKLVENNIEIGGHQKPVENYRGVIINTLVDEGSAELAYCFIDDLFIGSLDLELLKFTIAHIKGATSPVLADRPDYNLTVKAVGPYHDFDCFVNVKQLIKIEMEDATSWTKEEMIALGLDNVSAVGGSVGFATKPGSFWSGKVFVKVDGAKRGICKMLDFESAVLKAPSFIPASAYLVTVINLDIKKAFDELYNIVASI